MKLATFNVENMFERAKALNGATWAAGRPSLEAHQALNELFNKTAYGTPDKKRMLDLLKQESLLKTDEGRMLRLRKIRGKFLNRPRSGAVTVAAAGRGDWIGWAELKTEPVEEVATENTARVIQAVDADILGVVEAEDRTTLRLFNEQVLPRVGAKRYAHVMLVDGNDERGIDVGMLSRADCPIVSMCSHVDDEDGVGQIFSRDCAEYQFRLPGEGTLWVLMNHFKSKGYGSQSSSNAKRRRQAARVREIYESHAAAGDRLVAVIGDFNDHPGGDPLRPLLAEGSTLKDVSAHPGFDDGGRPGTHGNCTASSKIDYILLSPELYAKVSAAGIERRGMWGGRHGTLWPHFPEVGSETDAASDHAAMWVDLAV